MSLVMSDARRTNVTVRSCPQMCSAGHLRRAVVCPSSQPRAMGLPEMPGRSYRVWSPRSTLQTQALTLTHLHSFALAQLRTNDTTASYGYCCLSRRKEKASWTPKCSVFGSVTRSQQIPHFEIYSAVLPICTMPTAVKALWSSSGTVTTCD